MTTDTQTLADETIATVKRWLAESATAKADPSAERLAGVLKDPRGLEFTIGFVDKVVRPEDLRVAGRNLERVSHLVPSFLPWYLRFAIVVGGGFAAILPWPIVPIARAVLRRMVGHLVIDATPEKLDKTLVSLRQKGIRLNINLLGEAVLGDDEANHRLEGTRELLARDDVDYVSIKVSSVVSQLSMWAFDDMVDRVVERLTPLYELAAASPSAKFINLDMEEFRDLDLTVAVFQKLLEQPRLRDLEAGIVLQAYLPDALAALQGLTAWAVERRARGGAGIKVRVVKGANLAMEHVDATMHDWPLATWGTKQQTDTNYKRVLHWAFTPERTDAVRIGVAGHNLFDIAYAWLLSKQRKVENRVEFEMLLGMATGQAEAVKKDVGGLLLYTPVVHPKEFDSAISYLIRRLEENASSENFMSGVFELADNPTMFARESERFLASLAELDDVVPSSHRTQHRGHETPVEREGFHNEPDTDPAIAANRVWANGILERSAHSTTGAETLAAGTVTDEAAIVRRIEATTKAGEAWGRRPAAERAQILRDAADVLGAFRGRLIETMASETGKTIAEGDVEVSEAIDFARYYAERALDLDGVENATWVPSRLTVVTPPWNFPVAIPAGSVLAALASGSGVIIKPARQARRSGAVMVEALWEAGVPKDVLDLVVVEDGDLGRALVSHPSVDRVILTGAYETAQMFRSWRPDLPLLAETSGKNAIIVTPNADLDLAVADVVRSAFGHAGQKCSAASLVILVGSVGTSERFRRQLVDATTTLRVGYPQNPLSQMGPIIEPANGKLLRALTTLEEGQGWLVRPRELDESGQLWSPGVRDGVQPGSEFHLTEYFGPVLGIMTAATLDEAIALQNAVPYGLTAGIHSLDAGEVARWIDTVEAGNLYINRGITGAIVRRQPFGGWKRSTVGTSAKAGGPNYLFTLGSWEPVEQEPHNDILLPGISDRVASVVKKAQGGLGFPEFDRVRRAAQSDERAWNEEFGVSRDVSNLGVERNVFRYLPVPVTIRLSEGEPLGHLVRLLAAASRAGAEVDISSPVPLPTALVQAFDGPLAPVRVRATTIESDAAWLARARSLGTHRIRLIGGDALALARALDGSVDVAVWSGPVTTAGRVELLPFLHEQAVSITAHRFGNPDHDMAALPV
ncbi:MAG: 1-pyrroline-5-carboxylate dehydrogenase [Micrococcales bacterium 70-64]|nr:proline dehydrogenase family protein [Leifsonia sp.]ODU63632.1 MAG: 1-pyrroline-5-carboxylate dehydrogenase [Leifsonia sp. SCN 70-46]OJX85323.1 MAG: 1-pyrroline-5-carboxylate dehydrogenase [Micrococcales bacterium 70-64]